MAIQPPPVSTGQVPSAQAGLGQINPQDFWNNLGSVVSTVAPIALGLMQANPQMATRGTMQGAGPGQIRPQDFWSALGSLGAAQQGIPFAQGYGQQFGMPDAYPTASPMYGSQYGNQYGGQYGGQYGTGQISPQDLWNCVGAIVSAVAPMVASLLQANSQLAAGGLYGGAPGQMRPQELWGALNGLSGGGQQGLPYGQQQYGQQYGLGYAGPGLQHPAMYHQGAGQISPQDFWRNFASIMSSVAAHGGQLWRN